MSRRHLVAAAARASPSACRSADRDGGRLAAPALFRDHPAITVWRSNGEIEATLRIRERSVDWVSLLSDRQALLYKHGDVIRRWDFDAESTTKQLCARIDKDLTDQQWRDYAPDWPADLERPRCK